MKKNIAIAGITAWVLVTTGYVIYDIWDDYKVSGMQKAYNQGVEETTVKVIDEITKSNCEAVEVYAGEKKVQIVNSQCLPPKEAALPTTPATKK